VTNDIVEILEARAAAEDTQSDIAALLRDAALEIITLRMFTSEYEQEYAKQLIDTAKAMRDNE
jgi:hypothetical protein